LDNIIAISKNSSTSSVFIIPVSLKTASYILELPAIDPVWLFTALSADSEPPR